MKFAACIAALLSIFVAPATANHHPDQYDGTYAFECADATFTISILLGLGGGKSDGGSNTLPIYCGPVPPTGDHIPRYDEYQARLDAAEVDFENGCNQLHSDLNLEPNPTGKYLSVGGLPLSTVPCCLTISWIVSPRLRGRGQRLAQ